MNHTSTPSCDEPSPCQAHEIAARAPWEDGYERPPRAAGYCLIARRRLAATPKDEAILHSVFANRSATRFWYIESGADHGHARRAAQTGSRAMAERWIDLIGGSKTLSTSVHRSCL